MKGLSDWQLDRVRDALRAYHSFERDHEGKRLAWSDVRDAIAYRTGFEFGSSAKHGAERLRQFVEGIEDRTVPGHRRRPVPKPEALEAIVAFVTHQYVRLLSVEELQEETPSASAFLRLLEYLDDGSSTGRLVPPEKLQGTFEWEFVDRERVISSSRKLTLERSEHAELIQVTETEERFRFHADDMFSSPGDAVDRSHRRLSTVIYRGWAVLTPEDNLFFFLKNEQNQRNSYYATIAASSSLWHEDAPFDFLALTHYDFPIDLDLTAPYSAFSLASEMKEAIAQNVRTYLRDTWKSRLTVEELGHYMSPLLNSLTKRTLEPEAKEEADDGNP